MIKHCNITIKQKHINDHKTMILLIPVSLDSKQILKQLSMISHTLSLVSMVPSGDSTSVRRTCRKYAEQTYKFQYIDDSYLLKVRPLLFWDVTQP